MAINGTDPRADAPLPVASVDSARPTVARARTGIPNWMIAAGVLVAGLILFWILDSRRRSLSAPTTTARPADRRAGSEPTALYVPPIAEPVPPPVIVPPPAPIPPPPPPEIRYVPAPAPPPGPPPVVPPPPARTSPDPVLVLDTTTGEAGSAVVTGGDGAPAPGAGAGVASAAGALGGRSRASVLRNRSTTVPQGTLIPAVLETALDSTRPGPARALVTRDVRGFDGTKILIPRGSRLIGEYKADLEPGQNRALVIWTRLVRPDGATIDLGSPSADPLGRVGIKGKVNSHFLERFGSALLQTALGVGAGYATGLAGNNNNVAVLALGGGATGGAGSALGAGDTIKRTLRVKQGVAVSVFVAKDLDFTAVEAKK